MTPNYLHFPIARTFLEAGFHVVCDKPMTYSVEEAVELLKRTLRISPQHTGAMNQLDRALRMSQVPLCFAEQRQELRMSGNLHQSRVQFFAGSLSPAEIEADSNRTGVAFLDLRTNRVVNTPDLQKGDLQAVETSATSASSVASGGAIPVFTKGDSVFVGIDSSVATNGSTVTFLAGASGEPQQTLGSTVVTNNLSVFIVPANANVTIVAGTVNTRFGKFGRGHRRILREVTFRGEQRIDFFLDLILALGVQQFFTRQKLFIERNGIARFPIRAHLFGNVFGWVMLRVAHAPEALGLN